MATYTDITYHLVFGTKHRVRALDKPRRDDLYRFIWGLLKNRDCHLYRIGGVEDHIHILTSLHASLALADLIREIKTTTSAWIKGRGVAVARRRVSPDMETGSSSATARALDNHAVVGILAVIYAAKV